MPAGGETASHGGARRAASGHVRNSTKALAASLCWKSSRDWRAIWPVADETMVAHGGVASGGLSWRCSNAICYTTTQGCNNDAQANAFSYTYLDEKAKALDCSRFLVATHAHPTPLAAY